MISNLTYGFFHGQGTGFVDVEGASHLAVEAKEASECVSSQYGFAIGGGYGATRIAAVKSR